MRVYRFDDKGQIRAWGAVYADRWGLVLTISRTPEARATWQGGYERRVWGGFIGSVGVFLFEDWSC